MGSSLLDIVEKIQKSWTGCSLCPFVLVTHTHTHTRGADSSNSIFSASEICTMFPDALWGSGKAGDF
eukprot:3389480-Amphidinium_carterae.2